MGNRNMDLSTIRLFLIVTAYILWIIAMRHWIRIAEQPCDVRAKFSSTDVIMKVLSFAPCRMRKTLTNVTSVNVPNVSIIATNLHKSENVSKL